MPRYEADALYIASIFPSKLETIRKNHGLEPDVNSSRCTVYHMPQVFRDKKPIVPDFAKRNCKAVKFVNGGGVGSWCAVVEVFDSFENMIDVAQLAAGRKTNMSRPIRCQEIAENLIKEWATSIMGVAGTPGVRIIQGTCPTQEEMAQMMQAQVSYYEGRVIEGDRLYASKNKLAITQEMYDGAAWLKKQREWAVLDVLAECPLCYEAVHPNATICRHCGKNIKRMPKELEALNAEPVLVEPAPAGVMA